MAKPDGIPDGPFTYRGVRIYPPANGRKWRAALNVGGQQRQATATTMEAILLKADDLARDAHLTDPAMLLRELATIYLDDLASDVAAGVKSRRYLARQQRVLEGWVLPTKRDGRFWPGIGETEARHWIKKQNDTLLTAVAATGAKPDSITTIRAVMRSLVTAAWDNSVLPITANPMRGVKYTAPIREGYGEAEISRDTLPTTDDLDALIKGFDVVDEPRWGMAFDLKRKSGLRYGELIGLRPMDCAFGERRIIRVTRAIDEGDRRDDFDVRSPKNGRRREASFPKSIEAPLADLCEVVSLTQGPAGLLFPGTTPESFASYRYVARRFAKAGEAAGWPVVRSAADKAGHGQYPTLAWSPQDLRHYYACWMLFDIGADPAVVSNLLGHFNVSFTIRRYLGVRGDPGKQATDLTDDY